MGKRKPVLPEAENDERALIGGILCDPEKCLAEIADLGLKADHFNRAECRDIFGAVVRMTAQGVPLEVAAITAEAGVAAGVATDLIENHFCVAAHARFHGLRIRDAAIKRDAVKTLQSADGPDGIRLACERITAGLPTATSGDGFPSIMRASDFTATPIERPAEVINGVLYRGGKLVFGGPSKAYKTWDLIDLAEAVAVGGEWLGFRCTQGPALYINLELIPYSVQHRISIIAQARGHAVSDVLRVWNLRGLSCPLDRLLPELLRQIKNEAYSLIVVDPIYKTLAGREENDTGAIGEVCNEIEQVAVQTGAAVAFGSHFAKGNAAGKNAIDRISGSGVFARDPDAILTATPHDTEGAFTLDLTLRDFAPIAPFVIRWEYPRMVRDGELDPAQLKQAKAGRAALYSLQDIMAHIGTEPISSGDWKRICCEEKGLSHGSFYTLKRQAEREGLIEPDGKKWKVKARFTP